MMIKADDVQAFWFIFFITFQKEKKENFSEDINNIHI